MKACQYYVRSPGTFKLDVTDRYPNASTLPDSRAVFRIGGNYRLVVHINYTYECVYIKWWDTHDEYEKIDAETVNDY